MASALTAPSLSKSSLQKAAQNHWLIYVLVVSPVLFRVSRYVFSVATRGAAEPLSILEIALFLAILYQVNIHWLFLHKPLVTLSRSDLFVSLFVLAAGISVIALIYEPVDHTESLKAFVRLTEYVTLYLIVSTNIRSWEAIRKLMMFLVSCGVAVSLLAIIQYVIGPLASTGLFPWGTWWAAFNPSSSFRAYSFFLNPLYVSAYLSIVWPINLGLLMGQNKGKKRTLYVIALLVNSAGILITFCRSGLVALAVALFPFVRERARIAVAGGALVFLVGSYIIPNQLRVRVFLEDQESRDSITTRIDRYKQGLETYASHPLFGVGLGNYVSYLAGGDIGYEGHGYVKPTLADVLEYSKQMEDVGNYTAENTILQYAGELGTFGLLAFVALCVHFLVSLWRLRKKSSAAEGWIVGLFAGLLAFLVCSMFTTFTAVEMNSMFWVVLGIAKAVWLRRPRSRIGEIAA